MHPLRLSIISHTQQQRLEKDLLPPHFQGWKKDDTTLKGSRAAPSDLEADFASAGPQGQKRSLQGLRGLRCTVCKAKGSRLMHCEIKPIFDNLNQKHQEIMTVGDLYNMFLRLVMASKESESEFRFDTGVEGAEPLGITAVDLDDDGDVCLECDSRCPVCMSAIELAGELRKYDGSKTVYFVYVDAEGSRDLYNIKDGGTRDRMSPDLRMVPVSAMIELLQRFNPESVPYFESGTINFTVNSVYIDEQGCLCLESNEIEELANYTSGFIIDELTQVDSDTRVYLYDDEAKEYYGIYMDENRTDPEGNPWINVR